MDIKAEETARREAQTAESRRVFDVIAERVGDRSRPVKDLTFQQLCDEIILRSNFPGGTPESDAEVHGQSVSVILAVSDRTSTSQDEHRFGLHMRGAELDLAGLGKIVERDLARLLQNGHEACGRRPSSDLRAFFAQLVRQK